MTRLGRAPAHARPGRAANEVVTALARAGLSHGTEEGAICRCGHRLHVRATVHANRAAVAPCGSHRGPGAAPRGPDRRAVPPRTLMGRGPRGACDSSRKSETSRRPGAGTNTKWVLDVKLPLGGLMAAWHTGWAAGPHRGAGPSSAWKHRSHRASGGKRPEPQPHPCAHARAHERSCMVTVSRGWETNGNRARREARTVTKVCRGPSHCTHVV